MAGSFGAEANPPSFWGPANLPRREPSRSAWLVGSGWKPPLSRLRLPLGSAHRHIEVGYQTIRKRIDPTMHREPLAARPGLPHEYIGGYVPDLSHNIEFAQPIHPRVEVRNLLKHAAIFLVDLA